MSMMSVVEAASQLNVSERRVRQMLADGSIRGERVGRSWVIDEGQLHHRRSLGRPWSASSAWALLALADGADLELPPVARSRAKKRLSLGIENLVPKLSARCRSQAAYSHPGVLSSVRGAIVQGGVSAAPILGADLIAEDEVDGYIRSSEFGQLVQRFALDERSDRPNVMLRVVDDAVWPFVSDQQYAGRSVVAVDLLESSDPRAKRAGSALLEEP